MQFALRTAEGVWGTGSYAARFCELLRGFGFENPAGSVQFACELVNGFGSSQRLVAAVGCRPEQMGYWRFARMTELADVADLKSAAPLGRAGSNPAPGTNWSLPLRLRCSIGHRDPLPLTTESAGQVIDLRCDRRRQTRTRARRHLGDLRRGLGTDPPRPRGSRHCT